MSAVDGGTVTVLRLTDTDRHALLRILIPANHDGDLQARRLINQIDEAYTAALATARAEASA
ncbi:hypothetical protein [Mycolicibacter minnesotensis]